MIEKTKPRMTERRFSRIKASSPEIPVKRKKGTPPESLIEEARQAREARKVAKAKLK